MSAFANQQGVDSYIAFEVDEGIGVMIEGTDMHEIQGAN